MKISPLNSESTAVVWNQTWNENQSGFLCCLNLKIIFINFEGYGGSWPRNLSIRHASLYCGQHPKSIPLDPQ